ncbi:MAG TPA: hypothetical protein VD790_09870 [Thermoleophilaceae bacterium]|nr:hypothetical protein [Thermoleophilaceae bacterium]
MLSPTRIGPVLLVGLALATQFAGGSSAAREGQPAARERDSNPCLDRERAKRLLCPDLKMSPPAEMFVSRTSRGRARLHAANSINSVGRGPAELRGRRASKYTMDARQVVYRTNGKRKWLDTRARLLFKAIPGQYRYWKFLHAAKFELWRLNDRGVRTKRVRVGPKVSYCLRDLERRNGHLRRSPKKFHYPACNQDLGKQRVTLGTSVGWSDVYPATYHEQFLYVTGLRGCFAYVHIADPRNGIYESNERNNEGERIVRLPWKGASLRGCPNRSREKPPKTGPDGGAEAPRR